MINIKYFEQYLKIIDETNIVSKTDEKGIITYINDNFCNISGYTREELLGQPHNIIRHPDMPKEIFQDLWDTLQIKKTSWSGIIKNKKKNGGYYWVKTIASPIFDKKGKLIEYISVRSDVTQLQDSIQLNTTYKSILDQSNLLVVLDKYGCIKYANAKFCNLSTYKYEDLIGKKYIDFITKSFLDPIDKTYQEVLGIIDIKEKEIQDILHTLDLKKQWRGILKNRGKIGNTFRTSTIIIPFLDGEGNVNEFYLVQTDITDLEIAKNQLKKSFNSLKDLDQKKDDFLNIASHELRTPMTSIKGYLSMMLDGDIGEVDEEAKKYLSKVYNNVESLLSLINDMLDISKIESGKMQFLNEKQNLNTILQEVIYELNIIAKDKNILLENNINTQFDLFFICDRMRFKQVILNILGNAIKFTPHGGKIIIDSGIIKNKIHISIKDTGIGISADDIKKIFHKFGQVKNSLTRDIGGTGLGLSVSKAIIESFKGEIQVESKIGEGSNFIIILPNEFYFKF